MQNPPTISPTLGAPTTCNGKTTTALNLSAITTATAKKTNDDDTYDYYFGIDCNGSSKYNGNKSHDSKSKPKQNSASGSGHTDRIRSVHPYQT